jgi:hypothetical protein
MKIRTDFPPALVAEAAAVEITGRLTGTFLDSRQKSANSAQIPQFCPWSRELAGNFQLLSQVIQKQSDRSTGRHRQL